MTIVVIVIIEFVQANIDDAGQECASTSSRCASPSPCPSAHNPQLPIGSSQSHTSRPNKFRSLRDLRAASCTVKIVHKQTKFGWVGLGLGLGLSSAMGWQHFGEGRRGNCCNTTGKCNWLTSSCSHCYIYIHTYVYIVYISLCTWAEPKGSKDQVSLRDYHYEESWILNRFEAENKGKLYMICIPRQKSNSRLR